MQKRSDPTEAREELDGALKAVESYLLQTDTLSDENVDAAAAAASPGELSVWVARLDNILLTSVGLRLRIREHRECRRESDEG